MDSLDIFGWNQCIDNDFWQQYYLKLLLYPDFIRYYAAYVIQDLCNRGHKIYIISARNDTDLPNTENRSMYDITQKYLRNNNIQYNELFLTTNKWELINCLNINVMIEDNPSFFMSQFQEKNILLLCFNTPYNQNVHGKNIIRVYSWHDVLFKINNTICKEDTNEH